MLKLVSNGGAMIDTDDFYIIQKSSGIDELIFNISVFDKNYPKILEEAVIEYEQPYLVKAIDAGPQTVKVKCQLNLDELKADMHLKYSNDTKTLAETINEVLPKGWTLLDQSESAVRRKIEGGYTPYEIIMECMNTYDVAFRFDVKERKITAYKTDNFKPLGAFASGDLNLKEINYKGKSTTFYTRLYAYGKNGLSFASINDGKSYIDNFQYSDKVICAYWQDDRYEVKKDLLEDAKKKLIAASIPDRIYECTVADLAKTNPDMYGFQDFSLFSIIRLIDEIKNTSVYYQVVEYLQYPFYPEKNVVTLSSAVPKIQESVKDIKNEISNQNSSFWSVMRNAIDSATDWITGLNGGYVILHRDENDVPYELLITDNQTLTEKTNVWRWSKNGLEYSSKGYNGTYAQAIRMDGAIVADFINAGTMLADRIRGGTLKLGGSANENGTTQVLDQNGKEIVRLDKSGILTKGSDSKKGIKLSEGQIVATDSEGKVAGSLSTYENGKTTGIHLSSAGRLEFTAENEIIMNGSMTKSGTAEFSDGSYLKFINGMLVGGNTKEGAF